MTQRELNFFFRLLLVSTPYGVPSSPPALDTLVPSASPVPELLTSVLFTQPRDSNKKADLPIAGAMAGEGSGRSRFVSGQRVRSGNIQIAMSPSEMGIRADKNRSRAAQRALGDGSE